MLGCKGTRAWQLTNAARPAFTGQLVRGQHVWLEYWGAYASIYIVFMCCRYGKQIVPLDDDTLLHYKPGKCMELLGFTDRVNVPRW